MKAEQTPNPYQPNTFPPEPLTSSEYAAAIDAICYELAHRPCIPPERHRELQKLRMRLFHMEITTEAKERAMPGSERCTCCGAPKVCGHYAGCSEAGRVPA